MRWRRHVTTSPSSYLLSRWIFLRLLGIVYFVAFTSSWLQVHGLIGRHGILPLAPFLHDLATQLGPARYVQLPTLFWLSASDAMLHGVCGAGTGLSCLLIAGIAPVSVLCVLWVLYLSLAVGGQEFFLFRWDFLLLDTGFLAIFLAPLQWRHGLSRETPPSTPILWLLRWLFFRLMFSVGISRVLIGDPTWHNLTALQYHYETQPLPTWIGWCVHQLPGWFHILSTLGAHVMGLLVPWCIFASRRLRAGAAVVFTVMQVWIMVTGNYFFFNLLTIALCIPLVDDAQWLQWFHRRLLTRAQPLTRLVQPKPWPIWIIGPLTATALLSSIPQMMQSIGISPRLPPSLFSVSPLVAPLRLANPYYGMFATMVTTRSELIFEGSMDGTTWFPYEFRCKPGDPARAPCMASLRVPRLDWMLWYVPVEPEYHAVWFAPFCEQLLLGSPPVTSLLATNPFPTKPPRHLRVLLYAYRFSNSRTKQHAHVWWERSYKELFGPTLSLAVPPQQNSSKERAF